GGISPGIFWPDPDCLGTVDNGRIVVLFAAVSVAAIGVGPGIFWLEADGLGVVGNGLVVVVFAAVSVAAVRVGPGIARPKPDRLGVVGNGLVVVVFAAVNVAAVGVGNSLVAGTLLAGIDQHSAIVDAHLRRPEVLCIAIGPFRRSLGICRASPQQQHARKQGNRQTHDTLRS